MRYFKPCAVLFQMLVISFAAHAASFMPLIHNFNVADYHGALQNWDLAQGADGEIYVGNNKGVLCYDGYRWSLTPLKGDAVARSLLCVGNRLYVGAYQDFGYMERDEYGTFQYHSLWPSDYKPHDDEIWNIVRDKNGTVYFQSFAAWFSYDGKRVQSHFSEQFLPLYFHEVRGEIYAQVQNGDYYHLVNGVPHLVVSRQQVGGDHVVAALPGREGHLILCSQWHGLFDFDGERCVPLRTSCDAELRTANVNRATLIAADSTMVIGTILGGIYGIAPDGQLKWHYHMGNKLNNNAVLRLMADDMGNVWAALNIGVAMIATASPYSLLSLEQGMPSLGMVYGLAATWPYLYIATNQAAWQYNWLTRDFHHISGSDGQNWHVTSVDDMLLLGNNDGMKLLNGTVAGPLVGANNSSTCIRKCVLSGQDVLLESSYYSMRLFRKQGGKWTFSHAVQGFHAPVSEFEVDHLGNIWVAHISQGLFRVTLSPDLVQATVRRYDTLGPDTIPGMTHVMKVCGRVLFSRHRQLYTYDDRTDSIVPFDDFGDLGSEVCSATSVDDNTFWLATDEGFMLMKRDGQRYKTINSVSARFFGLDCNDTKSNVYVHDSVAYFNLNNGVGRLNMRRDLRRDSARHRLAISSVVTSGRKATGVKMPVKGDKGNRPSSLGIVSFELSYPNFSFNPVMFEFELKGGGVNLHSESGVPQVEYAALAYGDYRFTCKVKTLDGDVLDQVDYYFKRPRPFYASWLAWVIYALLLGGCVYMLVQYRTRKTAETLKRQFADKRLQQDIKVLEQEKIIAEQRHQLLTAQLDDKTREVASMALDAVARNRAIESIRDTLREKRRKGSITQGDMADMLRQLGENADSDNFWEVYQNNFNLIHKNFFKKLRTQYPSLTPTDLRFCALLRLNLSTKSIAQFTGLSVRGVEGARYRLRKKLGLHEGVNLVDFLLNYE
ncbi:MAG: hypothetical protein J5565_01965 [Muribaculaceae bacterium]|nr:hypothetical protein [Muribaculaceae bacterium]